MVVFFDFPFNHRSVFILSEPELQRSRASEAPVSLTAVTLKRWMCGRSKESHLFPLTHSVKWIEGEPFDLAFTLPFLPPTCRVHTALAITANREGDGSKILSG